MFKDIVNKIKTSIKIKQLNKEFKKYDILNNIKMKDIYRKSNIKITILGLSYIEFISILRKINELSIDSLTRSLIYKHNLIELKDTFRRDGYIYDITSDIKFMKELLYRLEKDRILYINKKNIDSNTVIGLQVAEEVIKVLEEFLNKIIN